MLAPHFFSCYSLVSTKIVYIAFHIALFIFSGRELFMSNASLFVDDVGAWEQYERDESENNEPEVGSIYPFYTMMSFLI